MKLTLWGVKSVSKAPVVGSYLEEIANFLSVELGDPVQFNDINTAFSALDLGNIGLMMAQFIGDLYLG